MRIIAISLTYLAVAALLTAACRSDWGIEVPQAPHIALFRAEPETIARGDTSKLVWFVQKGNFSGDDIILIDFIHPENFRLTGLDYIDTVLVFPDTTTIYHLSASNSAGYSNSQVTVIVQR